MSGPETADRVLISGPTEEERAKKRWGPRSDAQLQGAHYALRVALTSPAINGRAREILEELRDEARAEMDVREGPGCLDVMFPEHSEMAREHRGHRMHMNLRCLTCAPRNARERKLADEKLAAEKGGAQ